MIRKFSTALTALLLLVSGVYAEEVKGIFKKAEGGKITIEVDGKAKEYKTGEKVKTDKLKEGAKVILDVDGETAKSVKMDKK